MRSIWKINVFNNSFYRYNFIWKIQKMDFIKIWSKGTRIFKNLINKKLNVYNGKNFISVLIQKEMYNFFIGSYVITKHLTAEIHKKSVRNRRGRQKKI